MENLADNSRNWTLKNELLNENCIIADINSQKVTIPDLSGGGGGGGATQLVDLTDVAGATQTGQMMYYDGNDATYKFTSNLRVDGALMLLDTPIVSNNGTIQILNAITGTSNNLYMAGLNRINNSASKAIGIGESAGYDNQSSSSIAIGFEAGKTNQGSSGVFTGSSIAIGANAGETSQGSSGIAIGTQAGNTSQAEQAVAIGQSAGRTNQGIYNVAIGSSAGNQAQSTQSVAVGALSGQSSQGTNSLSIGFRSGHLSQSASSVAVGAYAGETSQATESVAIGFEAGQSLQGQESVCIGHSAGKTSQGTESVAVGKFAGETSQGNKSVAVGFEAGQTGQFANAVAIGNLAGKTGQGTKAVAIGTQSGETNQSASAVSIGDEAGFSGQSSYSVAIGQQAGRSNASADSISIGRQAGNNNIANNSIAIGKESGKANSGQNSIYVGELAGHNGGSFTNNIIINATGAILDPVDSSRCYIAPVRNDAGTSFLKYNSTSNEVTYETGTFQEQMEQPLVNASSGTGNLTLINGAISGTLNRLSYTPPAIPSFTNPIFTGTLSAGSRVNTQYVGVYNINNHQTIFMNGQIGRIDAAIIVQYSDDRIKSRTKDISNATNTLMKLKPLKYEKHIGLKVPIGVEDTDLSGVEHFTESGFEAQDVLNIPELAFTITENNDLLSIGYQNYIAYLVKALQEQHARIQTLENILNL